MYVLAFVYPLGRGHSKSSLGSDPVLCVREKGRVQPVGFQILAVLSKKREQEINFQCHLLDKMVNSNKGEKPLFFIYHHQKFPPFHTLSKQRPKFKLIGMSYSPHSANASKIANKPVIMKTFGCIKMTAWNSCWEFKGVWQWKITLILWEELDA